MVQGQFTGYGGGFNSPQVIPGIQNGQWNLAYWVVPIPLPFGESIIQSTEVVIPILKARMNDAYAVTRQQMASLLYTNNGAQPLYPDSFQSAFDNGTNFPTYGGINRNAAGNANFQGQYINLAAAPWATPFTAGATRKSTQALLTKITDVAGGESPTYGVMNPGDFATLNNDFVGIEAGFINPRQVIHDGHADAVQLPEPQRIWRADLRGPFLPERQRVLPEREVHVHVHERGRGLRLLGVLLARSARPDRPAGHRGLRLRCHQREIFIGCVDVRTSWICLLAC